MYVQDWDVKVYGDVHIGSDTVLTVDNCLCCRECVCVCVCVC